MAASLGDVKQPVEPIFLSRAQENSVSVRIGQMNRIEHEGSISDVGKYEINVNVRGTIVTLLKQEISYLTAPTPLIESAEPPEQRVPASAENGASNQGKPNVQQEFLDRAIREGHILTFFLLNGQRIKAAIEAYDNFTVLLRDGTKQHLFYKHAISTISR